MKAVKATYENGRVILAEPPPASTGPVEVLIVFPEPVDDPWHEIINDPCQRPELVRQLAEVRDEIKGGRASLLSTDAL